MYDDYELDYTYSNEFYAQDLDEIYEHHMHNTSYNTQDTYEIASCLVGSEMCIRDRLMMSMHEIRMIMMR